MTSKDYAIEQYCVDQFMGNKTSITTLNDLFKIIDKIEKQSVGSKNNTYKTVLSTTPATDFEGPLYTFSILLNQTTVFTEVSSMREASMLQVIVSFCKEWYLKQTVYEKLNSKKKSK